MATAMAIAMTREQAQAQVQVQAMDQVQEWTSPENHRKNQTYKIPS